MKAAALHISPSLMLPLDAQTQTLVVYGGKGMGKTNFGSVLVEELAAHGLRFSVLDPLDVWWGLQHGATRSSTGIDVVILGGPHGDIPIEPTAGGVVADFVADETVSTVIVLRRADGTMWTNGERIRFATDYCTRLYARQGERRVPLMQVFDEAGRFCPQNPGRGDIDIAKCIGAIEQLVEWGRNVGVGVCLITQRSARMNKSVSELADCMVAFRTVGPNSVAAIADWFGEHVPKADERRIVEQLRSLERGEALVVSPGWLRFEGCAQIRARTTFDSSATPKPGATLRAPGKARKPDLEQYRVRMAATIEQAEADNPAALKRRVAQLEASLAAREAAPLAAPPVEVSVLTDADRKLLTATAERLAGCLDALPHRTREIVAAVADLQSYGGTLGRIIEEMRASFGRHIAPSAVAPARIPVRPPPPAAARAVSNGALTGPEQRILDAAAWLTSLGQTHPLQTAVAYLAGYTFGGGAFNNPRGSLRTKGLLTYHGERLALTDTGQAAAHWPQEALTPDAIQARVFERLAGPETRILREALAVYPEPIAKPELAARAGYALGGAFNNPCGRLRSLGLVTYPNKGLVLASPFLFLEDAV